MVIQRIGPISFAKISGTLYAAIGLIIGGLFSLIALAGGLVSDTPEVFGAGALMGVGAIIVFPILYGVIGFVASLLGAWLYNVLAAAVGGIELEVS